MMFGSKSGGREGRLLDTLVGAHAVIRGDVSFSGKLYVEGCIIGRVLAEDGQPATLTLAGKGRIEGEIRVPVAVIDGEVVGDIHAGERIELTEHARVQGNVHYSVVEMSAGAQLNGRLVHAASLPLAALAAPGTAGTGVVPAEPATLPSGTAT